MGHCTSSAKRMEKIAAFGSLASIRAGSGKGAPASGPLGTAVLGYRRTLPDPVDPLHLQAMGLTPGFVYSIAARAETDQHCHQPGPP